MVSLLSVQSMPSSNLEAVAHEESDIWTNLSHILTKRDLLQRQGYWSLCLRISRDHIFLKSFPKYLVLGTTLGGDQF